MNDNEIIKALEHCNHTTHVQLKCTECKYTTGCKSLLLHEALDLINRLKLENEDLKSQIKNYELEAELAWEREVMLDER
jgi:hypothetical protein